MNNKITESMLVDFFHGELTPAEEIDILKWKNDCDENRRLFEDVRKEYLRVRWGIRSELIKGDYTSISNRIIEHKRRPQKKRWMQIAAAVAVAAAVTGLFFVLEYYNPALNTPKNVADFGPPSSTAVLELSDGTRHRLGDEKKHLQEKNGEQLSANSAGLVYDKEDQLAKNNKQTEAELIYNKLTIPRGAGLYKITLSDGSIVWVNSDSRLEYPVHFSAKERKVRICGEAFFEVVHDEARPFVVESGTQYVSVLGTKFNVAAYPSEPVFTTLASGRVKVTSTKNAQQVILAPGEQSVLNANSGELSTNNVSVADVVSWKDGITSIENQTLSKVLKTISRSYNVDFDLSSFNGNNVILKGSIPNDERLEVVLSVLSKVSDVKFKMSANGKIKVER
ncbi:MAG: hypothetical protein BGN96_07450 [Bacteroidales bacterium 45-6]|nr:MAG: hypothetical protein BGN96_07450 [Bacteroidales bacterium 45-6]